MKVTGYAVILDESVSVEEAAEIAKLLSKIKGIQTVEPVETTATAEFMATSREFTRVKNNILDAISEALKK